MYGLLSRLVITDLCMLFDLVPETRTLGLRPTELNQWWPNDEWHQFSDALFSSNPFAMLGAHQLVTRIFNAICAEIGIGSPAHLMAKHAIFLQRRQVVCQRMRLQPLL